VKEQTRERKKLLHLERAAADLVSKPTIRVSMGTKMPPPPTPPTVPKADPRNPITVANATLHPTFNSCTPSKESISLFHFHDDSVTENR